MERTQCAFCGGADRDVDAALEKLLFAGGRLNAALLGAGGARGRASAGTSDHLSAGWLSRNPWTAP